MPPNKKAKCPECGHVNWFDLALVTADKANVERTFKPKKSVREFRVICPDCHKPFVIELPEETNERAG